MDSDIETLIKLAQSGDTAAFEELAESMRQDAIQAADDPVKAERTLWRLKNQSPNIKNPIVRATHAQNAMMEGVKELSVHLNQLLAYQRENQ